MKLERPPSITVGMKLHIILNKRREAALRNRGSQPRRSSRKKKCRIHQVICKGEVRHVVVEVLMQDHVHPPLEIPFHQIEATTMRNCREKEVDGRAPHRKHCRKRKCVPHMLWKSRRKKVSVREVIDLRRCSLFRVQVVGTVAQQELVGISVERGRGPG